jgi:ATP-dependent helicase/DNAse subunit B
MPLKLVLGAANSAKAGEVLGAYAAQAPRGALLVVPTAEDALHYRRELAAEGLVLGSVHTFAGLVDEIARRAAYDGRRLTEVQRDHLLTRSVADTRFEELAVSASSAGFREAAGRFVAELERALLTPQRFSAALAQWTAGDERRVDYARDLDRLFRSYSGQLERHGRVDGELFAWRALDALRREPQRWGAESVFFYGFDDLTPLERDAVETLSRVVGAEVTVSLTYESSRVALAARAETVAELRPLADQVLELPARDDYYAPEARDPLHHLERSLFEPDAERVDPGPAIELLEAGGERAEAELVGERVLALIEAGVPPEEIAVVYRSVQPVAALLTRVFGQYGIPLCARREVPLVHTSLGRALAAAALCAWAPERAGAQDLLDFVRAPGVMPSLSEADELEARVRRTGVRGLREARALIAPAPGDLDALAAAEHPAEVLLDLARRLAAVPARGQGRELGSGELADVRALARLTEALAELEALGHQPAGGELLDLVERLTVAIEQPAAAGAVLLAEPLQIRARRFAAVFVCGLVESEFPLPARPEPFLGDERRRELAAASGLRLREHEDSLSSERYLFYAAVTRATRHVALSYRSSDEEGNLALPSPFIADVADVLEPGWRASRRQRLLADVVWEPETAPTAVEAARAEAALSAPPQGETGAPERRLGAEALAGLRHTEILSAGALETFAACPVKWLVERELQPDELAPEDDALVRGTVMHETLERLLAELGEPITPGTLGRAQDVLSRLLAAAERSPRVTLGAGQPEVVRAGALRAIEADLRRYLDLEAADPSPWRPEALELRFGFDPDSGDEDPDPTHRALPALPALVLAEDGEEVRIRGMIDRLDVDGHGQAVVRDYKSGTRRDEWAVARWSTDRQLQVAIYLLAVRELTDLQPVAGVYQPLRGGDLRGRGMVMAGVELGASRHKNDVKPPEAFQAELQDAARRAVALAAALRSGAITACPETCSRDGCAHPGICRSQ